MTPEQENKYDAQGGGRLFNRASGEIIPDDEPVFVFRARDHWALMALRFYRDCCANADHRAAIEQRIIQFSNFKLNHPDRMKEPDSP